MMMLFESNNPVPFPHSCFTTISFTHVNSRIYKKSIKTLHELSATPHHSSPITSSPENKPTQIPSKHFEADMTFSATLESPKNASTDMHIGPTFQGKHLDLEDRLFLVEPRTVPCLEQASTNPPEKKSIVANFFAAVTKVARKLKSVLRAPFQKISSNHHADVETHQSSNASGKTPNAPEKEEQTSPVSNGVQQHTQRRITRDEWCESSDSSIVFMRFEDAKSYRKSGMVHKGHARRMVQQYEYCSNVTTNMSLIMPTNSDSVSKTSASATSLHPDGKKTVAGREHWHVEQRSPLSVRKAAVSMMGVKNESASSTTEGRVPGIKKKAIKHVSFRDEVEVIGETSPSCSPRSPDVDFNWWLRRKTIWKKVFRVRRDVRIRTELY